MGRFNINTAGFLIVGVFAATWLVALSVWPFSRLEEKWERPRGAEREPA